MRSFIAIDLDDSLARAVEELQSSLKSSCPDLRLIPIEQLHLTLVFLGEIDAARVGPVGAALAEVAREFPPFDMELEGVGVFPPVGAVNIVWAGIRDPQGRLRALQATCERSLTPLGFAPEGRPFAPHLTIGRNKKPGASHKIREGVRLAGSPRLGRQQVAEVTLYESRLGPGGPTYLALGRHRLAGAGGGD